MNTDATKNSGWRKKVRSLFSANQPDASEQAHQVKRRSPRNVVEKLDEMTAKERHERLNDFFEVVGLDDSAESADSAESTKDAGGKR
ncbi:hypothetical protein [Corynebacterium sp.]|uniref:hypothetical protein n=1 Tax=Corynebacterium sp. TaxID=1720 RepID=UPI0026DAB6D1|nr:hypothetical protein [Corynebacterium sp.]